MKSSSTLRRTAFVAAFALLMGAVDASALAVPRPAASGITTSTGYNKYVALSWNGVSGANKYYIFRSTSSKWGKRVKIKAVSKKTRSFRDTSAIPGVTYWYWVCPVSKPSWKNGWRSKYYYNTKKYVRGCRALPAPKPVASYNSYTSYVKLTWGAVAYAKKYKIMRSTSSSYYYAKTLAVTTARTYYDTSAVAGTTYYYWILPAGKNGIYWYNSSKYDYGKKKAVAVALTAPQPSHPDTTTYSGAITIRWTRVTGQYPSSYRIYRSYSPSTHPGNGATWIGTVSSSSYGLNSYYYYYDFDISYYTDYYYWVCPVNSSGNAYYSASKYDCVWLGY